jgi:hypothetical protein
MMLPLLLALLAPQDPIHVVVGGDPAAVFGLGFSVAGGVDHDLDGVPDFLAGNPGYHAHGLVGLYGGADGLPIFPELENDHPSMVNFGWSVATIGDLDLDGRPDFVAGGIDTTVLPGLPGFADVRSSADGALLLRLEGTALGDQFGFRVAGLGDVDGDGVPDVAVGATEAWPVIRGYVRVHSGADGATIYEISGLADGDQYGNALANVGDVTGDGVDDMMIGAPVYFFTPGYVEVRDGATGALVWHQDGTTFDYLGWAVAPAGDVDLDGTLDVIVGAPLEGYVQIYRATDGAVVRTIDAPSGSLFFGQAVAGLGDVDGDGFSDLLVGAGSTDGPVFPGRAWIYSGHDGTVLRAFTGTQGYGVSAAAAGDMDVDGFPDGIVGAPQGGGVGPGYVEVREGRPELVADVHTLSMASGGTQVLDLHAGLPNGGADYMVLGTLGATSPGVDLLGATAPLTPDPYFWFTMNHPNEPPLANTLGTLDGLGDGAASFSLSAGMYPSLAGQTAHHAFGVLDLTVPSVQLVSNPVRLEFVP